MTEAWIKLPRSLLESEAVGSLSINAWRLIRFLMIEHMRHGGRANGQLLAPRRQLEDFGIGARHVSAAIEECEGAGLIECRRGVGRSPSLYALTWLPAGANNEPSNRWRRYVSDIAPKSRVVTSEGKSLLMTSEGKHLGYPKGSHNGSSDFRREVVRPPKQGYPKGSASIAASYQGGEPSVSVEGRGEGDAAGVAARPAAWTNGAAR
jgi:hypothetical protein